MYKNIYKENAYIHALIIDKKRIKYSNLYMGIFSFLFGGKYPSTTKYETLLNLRANEAKRFVEFADSPTWARYKELDDMVHSGDFTKRVDKLKNDRFNQSEAYRKLVDYKTLKNTTEIKDYLNMSASGKAERVDQIMQSVTYAKYIELQAITATQSFKNAAIQKDFKKTDGYGQLKTFKRLRKNPDIKFVEKTTNSVAYKNYKSIFGSDKLRKFEELEQYITSNEFINLKRDLEDKNRFKKSEEFKLLNEFDNLKNSKDIKWYLNASKNNEYAEELKWKLTFEEDFDHSDIDKNRWMDGYYWGKALLNDSYVTEKERQFFKPNNISIRNSNANIATRNEHCSGKTWNSTLGFIPTEFDYTSGMINTGNSFRQKYGKFVFKVKASYSKPLTHNIWMVGEKSAPQIDILSYGGNKKDEIEIGVHSQNGNLTNTVNGVKLNSDYSIVTVIWEQNEISWFINGVQVKSNKSNVPDIPMYIAASSNLMEDPKSAISGEMDIDWIRCYSK